MKKVWFLLMILFSLILIQPSKAEITLMAWDFTDNTGSEVTDSATTVSAYISDSSPSGIISRGSGIDAADNADRFNATKWTQSENASDAVSNNDYMEFSIAAEDGYQITINSINFNWQRSGTGPDSIIVRSNQDSYSSNLGSYSQLIESTNSETLTLTGFINITGEVSFRFYGYSATATNGSGGFEGSGNDIEITGSVTYTGSEPNVWINEIDADQTSTDSEEFIELVGESGISIDGYIIALYNGGNGSQYKTHTIGTFSFLNELNGYGFFVAGASGVSNLDETISGTSWLQNGSPDGIALFDAAYNLIFQYSYGGTFTGNATGSFPVVDFNINRSSIDSELKSMGFLINNKPGDLDTGFNNLNPTPGSANSDGTTDQSLPVSLSSFTASCGKDIVILNWSTESEIENLGFNIYRSLSPNNLYEIINKELIPGHGSTSRRHDYKYIDRDVINGIEYWYQLEDVDYSGNSNRHGPISAIPENDANGNYIPHSYQLFSAYPNPFNPTTTISYALSSESVVSLSVYDIQGVLVKKLLTKTMQQTGHHTLVWNASQYPSGIYIYKIDISSAEQLRLSLFSDSKKCILLK